MIDSPRDKMRVKITSVGDAGGMFIGAEMLSHRKGKIGQTGFLYAYVPGHGGDVWWVVFDGDNREMKDGEEVYKKEFIAPFCIDEMIEFDPSNPNSAAQS